VAEDWSGNKTARDIAAMSIKFKTAKIVLIPIKKQK
jgi:hypothetical protein